MIQINYNKIVIFDWGGIIESHRKGEYNVDTAIENLIKQFNPKESKNIVERYYKRSIKFGVNDTRDIKENKWFEQIKEEFNLKCTSKEFYDYYIKEFDNIEYYKDHPIVVHINTQKGKGYKIAEEHKEEWHWTMPFDIETGKSKFTFDGEDYGNLTGEYLLEKMKNDPKVVTIVAGVPTNIGFTKNRRIEAGEQFVDVGIAEEHAVALASGIAKNGGKPIFATHSSFMQRTYDQLSQDLCINNNPATILVNTASVYGLNDVTHLGLYDIPMISNIPNMVYLAPTSKEEYFAMLDWSIEQNEHPVAIRIPCNGVISDDRKVDTDYSNINKFKVEEEGEKVAIIALGDFYQLGEEVSKELKECNSN